MTFGWDCLVDYSRECNGRKKLIYKEIYPALNLGQFVISRHFNISSLVNVIANLKQAISDVSKQEYEKFIEMVRNVDLFSRTVRIGTVIEPDLVIFLDADAKYLMEQQGSSEESCPDETRELRQRYGIFFEELVNHPKHVVIDARRPRAELIEDVFKTVQKQFGIK